MEDKSHVGLMKCFYCGEASGVALDRQLRSTLPHQAVYDMHPCKQCEEYMKQGVIMIGITNEAELDVIQREEREHREKMKFVPNSRQTYYIPNPHRSGHFLVVSDDWVMRAIQPIELAHSIIRHRWTFAPAELCKQLNEAQATLEKEENESSDQNTAATEDQQIEVAQQEEGGDETLRSSSETDLRRDPSPSGESVEGDSGGGDEQRRREGEDPKLETDMSRP